METAIRHFRVRGQIAGTFTPDSGSTITSYTAGMQVELWHKGPLDVTLLGTGLTLGDGSFIIDFEVESPSPMIELGKINDVFVKVYYNNQVVTGNVDALSGSFD